MSIIYHDSTYLKNNPTWHEEDAPFKGGKIEELLKKHPIHFNTVCEVGCGSGEILLQLAQKYPTATQFFGFDISSDAIAIASRKATNKIQFEQKDITLAGDTSFFDLLLVIDVIEHLDDYFSFLTSIAPKSKYTIFHIPLDMCVWSLFREEMLIESKKRVGHIHNFTEGFIESILMDKGFKIIDKLYTEPTFTTVSTKQKIANLARKLLFSLHKKFCTKTIGGYSILLLTENNAFV
ncbi:class I SAM-dependent methyltransferase [Parasediminibacterium sp. JCM 36343]|uniref:class I SAM-dependent methyltransferase n=1 Tax=Parasediminibacterium sp. JCM 36343 TaxID=3374279 RepID=UPI003979BCC0